MPIRKIVTPKNVAQQLSKLPPLKTPVMDDIYPASVRDTHPFAAIKIDEVAEIAKAVPVVMRGSASVTLGGGQRTITEIEPLPVIVNYPITAHELNNVKTLTAEGQQTWLRNKLDYTRRVIRKTAEALAAQSLTGRIEYAMKTEAGLDRYVVDYGKVLIHTPALKWSASNATLKNVLDDLIAMSEAIEEADGGTEVEFKAGKEVFSTLATMIDSVQNSRFDAKVDGNTITIAGYKITRYASRYFDPISKEYKDVIDPKSIKAIARDGGFALRYLAIDDIDANLDPIPLYLKAIKMDDPSGYKLIGQSKPLPIPNTKSICDAVVV